MKSRIHNILLLVVALFTICSCSKPSKETFVSTLTIATMEGAPMDGASIVLSSEGEQYSFVIKSNTEWIIGCNAEWVKLSTATDRGNSEVTLSADATMMSRSAVVIIYTLSGQQIRASFNVVQHANAEQEPEERPGQDTEDDPEQQPEDNPEDQPENNPDQQPEDDPEDQPEDDPENQPEGNPEQQPENNPDQQPEESPENEPGNNTESGTPNNSYTKIVDASFLQTGTYFIGGYQNGTLHLATEGVSIENPSTERKGHVHTTPYIYNDSDGTLSAVGREQAIEVRLEAASGQNAYYLYFIGEGYLMATESNTGCLTFTDEARYAWHFSNADEGFEVRQQGDIDARLIISRRASDRLIRSIAGDEDDGNPIVLFRKN